ncbi:MAG: hypothetical protein GY906_26630 [bacterium]|nr:hypothetical protein [bacterium]
MAPNIAIDYDFGDATLPRPRPRPRPRPGPGRRRRPGPRQGDVTFDRFGFEAWSLRVIHGWIRVAGESA